MRLKLMTFDIHNTIIRVKGSSGEHYAAVARTVGVDADPQKLSSNFGPVWKEMKEQHPIYGYHEGMTSRFWWGLLLDKVFTRSGYVVDKAKMNKISDSLFTGFSHKDMWEVFPHSIDVLKHLRQKGLHLAVISNFDERLGHVLHELGLHTYFDFLVTSVQIGCEKPDPRLFHRALKLRNIAPYEAGHVGDDVMTDYWGARKVGMESFLLNRKNELSEAELEGVDRGYVLSHITDLIKYFPENTNHHHHHHHHKHKH